MHTTHTTTHHAPGTWRPLLARKLAALGLLAALFTGGCSTMQVAEPLTERMASNDPEAQMEFWHTLVERKLTSNDEAFHAVLLFFYLEDETLTYEKRVEALKERGFLPPDFDRPANEAVSRGTLAVLIANGLDVKRGVLATVFPHSGRYAQRELQYMGMYPAGSPHQTFTGGQIVAIIGRMEDYQRAEVAAGKPDKAEQARLLQVQRMSVLAQAKAKEKAKAN